MRKRIFMSIGISLIGLILLVKYSCGVEAKLDKEDVYRQLDLFADVFTYVKSDYVDFTENKDLV